MSPSPKRSMLASGWSVWVLTCAKGSPTEALTVAKRGTSSTIAAPMPLASASRSTGTGMVRPCRSLTWFAA